jgi:hypothetical protein
MDTATTSDNVAGRCNLGPRCSTSHWLPLRRLKRERSFASSNNGDVTCKDPAWLRAGAIVVL